MCGIAGLFEPERSTEAEKLGRLVGEMTSALTHRGPDAVGHWLDGECGVAFGHRRLAVIELGPEGEQPMVSGDGRWVAVYNGEIYNFRELRRRLVSQGLAFRGGSDTEVLLASVQLWGLESALDAWEGMFALALWDRRQRQLHLARDRFGEKPLYYGWVDGRLAFGSELKALRRLPSFGAEIDRDAVALFLRHNCIPAPSTIYRGVKKLLPGHWVTVDSGLRPGNLPPSRPYWSARDAVEEARRRPLTGSTDELIELADDTLSASVSARLDADVPVGAFLSGGIDSSLVVALMQRHTSNPVRTFTIGFADRDFDESPEAELVANHLGTDHTALRVDDADALGVIPELPDIWDEPFADASQIPTLLVSRLARSQVTVSLSGDAGDELFAGYNRHAWLERLWTRASVIPSPVRRMSGAALGSVPPSIVDGAARVAALLSSRGHVRNPSTKVAKLGKVLAADSPERAYLALISHWDAPSSLVLGVDHKEASAFDPTGWPPLGSVTEQMLWLDLTGYLPDDILTKVDRAAMATSLETRVPFLDRSVFDLAWRLPMAMKLHEGTTKWILRQVLHRYVPPELVERPKMGFGLPIGTWLRGTLRPWAEELLGEPRLLAQGLLDPQPIRRAWHRHLSGRQDLGYELWDVLVLQAWLDRWMPAMST
jgi:asparagine synthase (glutamine-hydrolysing)